MSKPYFLWDYNLTDKNIREILDGRNEVEKIWIISRILTHARFEDVWKYITIKDLVNVFPKLRLPVKVRGAWENALTAWGYHV